MFAISDDVQRPHIYLLRCTVEPPHLQVLQKHRRIMQCQQTKSWTPESQAPVRKGHGMAEVRCFLLKSLDHRNFLRNLVWIGCEIPVLQQIRDQWMQAINRNEFLREVEWRSKMINAAV